MSRRGVAALAGVPEPTLRGWLNRGRAEPHVEPYGSFARDYMTAERGLEACAAGTITLVVRHLYQRALSGQLSPEDNPQLKELLHVLAARYPEDWGTSAHRRPEPELTGAEWLEEHPLTHAQLVQLLLEPPEAVEAAQRETLDAVVVRMLESGWKPTKATLAALQGLPAEPSDPGV